MNKKYIWFTLLVIFVMLIGACTPTEPEVEEPTMEPEVEEPTEVPEVVSMYSQAPMLDGMDLPPVEERLPDDPVVITPYESVGEYGGTWFNVAPGNNDGSIKMAFYEPPLRWRADLTGYDVGLVESFEFNDDGTSVTYKLRPGLKWSDGAPYTSEDWDFWWNDLANNENYKVVQVPWWGRNEDGTPMTVEFPDDMTVTMTWDTARWIAPYIMAQGFWEWEPMMKPKHYLRQFHPDYEGADYDTLELNDKYAETPGYPTIFAWYLESITAGEKSVFVRNPYYWKVDTEGQQLPYLDYVEYDIQPDTEVRILNLSQGKYNASFRGTTDPTQIPFLLEQAEAGGYHLHEGWMNGAGAWPGFLINMDYDGEECGGEKEECRELLRNKWFRKGLSLSLDRQRILDVVWEGFGYLTQATISPQSWHFASPEGQEVYERWKNADVEFDPETAMEYFDQINFVDCDGDGWRDLPDTCAPFTFVFDLNDWGGERNTTETSVISKDSWEAVGINVLINNVIGTPDAGTRGDYGLYMIRTTHVSELDLWTYPDWVFPLRGGGEGSRAFPLRGLWYGSGGAEGIEPQEGDPAYIMQALYRQGVSEPDEQKRHEIVWETIELIIEEGPFTLGATGDQPMVVVVANNFRNIPTYGVLGPWAPASPGNTHPEQYWIEQ
jgi:peptide/nickel transport system substrate-binding protein